MNPTASPVRLEVIDALRALAAASVAFFHFTNGSGLFPADSWCRAAGSHGWLGVEIFFVISGFVIPFSMRNGGYQFPRDAWVFFAKRIVRLDPAYLAAIVLTLALWWLSSIAPGFAGQQPTLDPLQLLAHLGYLNAFLGYDWISPVFWTLAIEFQFYILIAIAYPLCSHRRQLVRVTSVFVVGTTGLWIENPSLVTHFGSLFALGISVFHFRSGMSSVAGFLISGVALTALAGWSIGWPQAIAGCVASQIIAFVNTRRFGWLAFLGSLSYSFYLVHSPVGGKVVNLGTRYANSLPSQIIVLLLAFVVSLGVAIVFFRLVERPSQRWSSAIRYSRVTLPREIQ